MSHILIPSICPQCPHSHNVAISSVPHSHSINMSMVSVSYSHIIDIFMVSHILTSLLSTLSMMSHLLIASICSWCHTFSQHQYSGHAPTCSVYPTLLHHCCLTFSCFLCCLHSLQVHVIFSPRKVFSCKPPLIKLMFPKAATFLKSFLFQKLWEVA